MIAAGEEQLLAAYMMNGIDDERWFLSERLDNELDIIYFDESYFERLRNSDEYRSKIEAESKLFLGPAY